MILSESATSLTPISKILHSVMLTNKNLTIRKY